MHIVTRILVVVTFLASWLVLLGRFSVLSFKHEDANNDTKRILPTPATSYVNNIGAAVAILWLVPGIIIFAIVSGRIEHQDIANTLWAAFTIILSLVCILGGSDLSGAINNVVTFDAVHMDVAFVCLAVISYAMLPVTTAMVRDSRAMLREQLIGGSEVELEMRGPDSIPKSGNPFVRDGEDSAGGGE